MLKLWDPQDPKIALQNEATLGDLGARAFATLSVQLLAWAYLPGPLVASVAVVYILVEMWGLVVVRRMRRGVTRANYAWLLGSSLVGATVYSVTPYLLWWSPGLTPKVFAFAVFVSALIHSLVLRSHHILFGIATALPIVLGFTGSVMIYLIRFEAPLDAFVGTTVLVIMLVYLGRSFWDMHKTHRQLIQASDEAQEASRAKSRFVAAMSHEIRTPLNGILGIAQILGDNPDPRLFRERVTILQRSAGTLKALVDDVLDQAKVEAGKLEIRPEVGDIADSIRATAGLFRPVAEAKGLSLTVEIDPVLPHDLEFDALRLCQILNNLLSNAVKFTDTGSIRVKATGAAAPQGWQVRIAISDTGTGIARDSIGRLFANFIQVDESANRAASGTGLGLSISRGLARLMHGDITLTSEPGVGSTFTLEIVAGHAPRIATPGLAERVSPSIAATPGRFAGRTVLLVDDNGSNRYIARAFLHQTGFRIVEAENGQEALDQLLRHDVDLVLLDMHMPVMDGKTAFRAMQGPPYRMAHIPVIALTADASAGDRDSYLALGLTGYLSKPLQQGLLLAEIDRAVAAFEPQRTEFVAE